MVKPVWNNAQRVNHQNFAKKTHLCAKRNLVPRVVLTKSGLVSVNTARQVNVAYSKTIVNVARPMSYLSNTAHSTIKRPIHKNTTFKNSNINQMVNTARDKKFNTARPKAVVNAVKGNNLNDLKAAACWVWKPKHKIQVSDGLGPQKKLIFLWNMSYLTDYEEIDGGYVAFGGNPKGGKITRKGSGLDWLFDIDALTKTMNYEPIVAGTQSNGFAGTKASDIASYARKETEPVKDYILLPLWTPDLTFSQDLKSSHDDGSKPSSDDGKKVDEDPRKDSECKDQEKENNVNITNNVNTVSSTVNVAGTNEVNVVDFSRDDEDDGAMADMNNLDTTVQVSPNLTIRIHKDHPHDQEEPKKVERGIVIRNKARLVAQVYIQEEGIDYDEVFAHVARIEAIRLFLAYASFKDFMVYQMDVKSAFLNGKIKEEVYLCQPPRFEDPDFPDRVYKKFEFIEVKTASTPMETQKPLLKDEDGKEVDVHMYRSMIGSLMYLTSSRPDIMFAVCACAYQVNPKVSHIHAVKREDLETLWKLVKAKHGSTRPEEGYERVLWGDLKKMFDPHVEDQVWRNQQDYRVLD
ncbi:retrovirus-related pol polyprotein from transposon TNT 1-94 [Tanacetum coccineum]